MAKMAKMAKIGSQKGGGTPPIWGGSKMVKKWSKNVQISVGSPGARSNFAKLAPTFYKCRYTPTIRFFC